MFNPLPARFDFPAAEKEILAFWDEHDVFRASVRLRADAPRFVFYEGPPTANGLPHPGHCLTRVMKDIFPRYMTMRGFLVERKGGWDTHGLPVEREVCKELGIRTKHEIEAYGVENFNLKCIQSVFRYTREWEEMTRRLAYWVDLKEAYVTYHQSYIESVWWSLKTLFDRGVLYQGHKVVWWWAQGGTALSSGEVGEGYKTVDDPSVFVKFPLAGSGGNSEESCANDRTAAWTTILSMANAYPNLAEEDRLETVGAFADLMLNLPRNLLNSFDGPEELARHIVSRGDEFARKLFAPRSLLVWTTTPWTLVSNQFAAVHPELRYTLAYDAAAGESLLIATALVEAIAKRMKRDLEPLVEFSGEELVGLHYHPPFPESYYDRDFDDMPGLPTRPGVWDGINGPLGVLEAYRREGGTERIGWRVLAADFVTIDSGTGVVHEAPAFGEVDFNLLQQERARFEDRDALPVLCAVAPDGTFNSDAPEKYRGRWVKDCDKDIVRELRDERKTPWGTPLLYHQEQYRHDYPFCPQAPDDPLIQYARKSWFVRTSQFKEEFLKNNAAINWLPEHIKEGRFGDLLRNNVDWALSRERFWGTPLPIWVCQQTGKMEAIGSFAELQAKPGATDVTPEYPQGYWNAKVAEHQGEQFPEHLRVHKPYIDEWTYDSPFAPGARMKRVPEVIDCWWDAGSMPFAQWGFPHAPGSVETFLQRFPADFISEAIDQTRGWFYGLLAIATLLFSKTDSVYEHARKLARQHSKDANLPDDWFEWEKWSFREYAERRGKDVPRGPADRWDEVCYCDSREPGQEIATPILLAESYPVPFRTCIVLGHIAGEDGNKMSKKLRNYKEPTYIFDTLGADAMRWYFLSAQAPWTSTRFAESAIRDAQREFLVKLYNILSFFTIYASIDGFDPGKVGNVHFADGDGPRAPGNRGPASRGDERLPGAAGDTGNPMGWRPTAERTELDRWIATELRRTVAFVRESMDRFENFPAAQRLNDFVDALSNWYVRRSRDRFWRPVESEKARKWESGKTGLAPATPAEPHSALSHHPTLPPSDQEKWDAYHTLYGCLRVLSQLIAPFVPFFAEKMHQVLRVPGDPESIHLCDYPKPEDIRFCDEGLAATMETVRELVALGRSARTSAKLKVRQPLSLVEIILTRSEDAEAIRSHAALVAEELNVKRVELVAEADQYVTYKVVPNFKAIGAKFRELVPRLKDALGKLPDAAAARRALLETGALPLDLDGRTVTLTPEEVEIRLEARPGWSAAQGRAGVVVLSTEITPELRDEGLIRELVHHVQAARKEQNLAYQSRVVIAIDGPAEFVAVVRRFAAVLEAECLAAAVETSLPADLAAESVEIEGVAVRLAVRPVERA